MRLYIMPSLIISCVVSILASKAYATTGWDCHSVTLCGKYRIHGEESSFVNLVGDDGELIEPALCSIIGSGPPEYSITATHLHIRYWDSYRRVGLRNYCSIELESSLVSGPMKEPEFNEKDSNHDQYQWKSPWTAADKFEVTVRVIVFLVVVASVALLYLMFRVVGGYFRPASNDSSPSVLDA